MQAISGAPPMSHASVTVRSVVPLRAAIGFLAAEASASLVAGTTRSSRSRQNGKRLTIRLAALRT
jgi:hypothetical protein